MSGWLSAMAIDDFRHDPILATQCIFGFQLPPHQQIRLWSMWTHNYCFDSSGFGTGKTFTIALCAALRAMLFEDTVAGLIGKTFEGSKRIYENFDTWIDKAPLFRDQVKKNRIGDPMSVHGGEACVLTIKNGSVIRAIPPDFQKDAERVASESWTDGYFDEVNRYRNYAAFDRIILGRVRKPIKPPDNKRDPIFGNHMFFGGTAQYKWHPFYGRIQNAMEQISMGNPAYDVISFNYTHIPEKYDWLDNTDIAREAMMAVMRQDEIETEIMGRWVDDSVGFYNAKSIAVLRTLPDSEIIAL